jgi:hypothetical protein
MTIDQIYIELQFPAFQKGMRLFITPYQGITTLLFSRVFNHGDLYTFAGMIFDLLPTLSIFFMKKFNFFPL